MIKIVIAAPIGTSVSAARCTNMTHFVRCIDDTLVKDLLTVGKVYEVLQINERDGYYVLSSGQFTMARFQRASAAEAGYG